ncbi:MAG: response regulator [Myxococcota bacterium]
MLNDEVGKNFRGARKSDSERRDAARDAVRILVVDPVLGSRFSLVRAASQPGFVVDACASADEADRHLARTAYDLVIADEALGEIGGLEFLERAREASPDTARALVSGETAFAAKRAAIERASLLFIVPKPWSLEGLRRTLRELFGERGAYAGWERIDSFRLPLEAAAGSRLQQLAGHELLLRGLLAGFNSCASPNEVFELLHAELAPAFPAARWLWVDERVLLATRLAGDWAPEAKIEIDALSRDERAALEKARRNGRASRLDGVEERRRPLGAGEACIGFGLRVAEQRVWTGLVWTRREDAPLFLRVLRELFGGLQMTVQRIHDAEARSEAAQELARRVSDELRMPVGALAHAVDVLRGEAERAGLPVEWVDRVSSESERVVRAVEHLEGEMLGAPLRGNAPTS